VTSPNHLLQIVQLNRSTRRDRGKTCIDRTPPMVARKPDRGGCFLFPLEQSDRRSVADPAQGFGGRAAGDLRHAADDRVGWDDTGLRSRAAADMALELDFIAGGVLFFASHIAALVLYLRNRRESTSVSQKLLAAALVIGTPAISYLLSERPDIAIYASGLGLMGAAAWMSRFPRYRVGIGAVLFVVSDWLIFSRMGVFDLTPLPDILVWPLYYTGQLMIATGVVQTLRGETPVR